MWSSVLITGITTDIKRHIRLIFYCKIPAVSYSNTYCSQVQCRPNNMKCFDDIERKGTRKLDARTEKKQ